MLKIRLQRVGKKHDPSFRVVLTDSRKGPKSGKFLEILGNYNARKGEPQLKGDRIKEWVAKGAQISDTVNNLLIKSGIIKGEKKDVLHHDRIKKALAKKEGEKPKEESKAEETAPSSEEGGSPAKEEEKTESAPADEKPEPAQSAQGEAGEEVKEERKKEEPEAGEEAKSDAEAKEETVNTGNETKEEVVKEPAAVNGEETKEKEPEKQEEAPAEEAKNEPAELAQGEVEGKVNPSANGEETPKEEESKE